MRLKIFKRFLILFKNKKYQLDENLKKVEYEKFFKRTVILKKIQEKLKSQKMDEIDQCRSLVKFFILKIKSKKYYTKDSLLRPDIYFFDFSSRVKPRNKKCQQTNVILSLFGKTIRVEGTVINISKVKKKITLLLIECEKCGSIFYFALETLNQYFPFLCCRANCSSQQFFSHFSRILTENHQKIQLGKISINYETIKSIESIYLDIYGNKPIRFLKGLRIFCNARINLSPSSKKASSIFSKKNLYTIYMRTRCSRILVKKYSSDRNFFYLSKNDFMFINQLNSSSFFHVLIKSMLPQFQISEGLKAGFLLLRVQQLNATKIFIGDNSVNFCLVLSQNVHSINFFIKEIAKLFPSTLFFNFENFKLKFSKDTKKIGFNLGIHENKFRNSLLMVEYKTYMKDNFNLDSFLNEFKEILKSSHQLLSQCIVVLFIDIDKNYFKKGFSLSDYSFGKEKTDKIFDLVFFLKDSVNEIINKNKISKILNQHNYKVKKKKADYFNNKKSSNNFSIFSKFMFKKKISVYFIKKYLNFVQHFNDSNLSKKSFDLMMKLYQKFKTNRLYFSKYSLNILPTILKLGQCRAKFDLRKQIVFDDILDGLEIFFDSKPKFFENLNKINPINNQNTCKKINLICYFLRLLHKFFYRTGQTLFEVRILERNFQKKIKFFEIIEILNSFKIIKKINKSLISLNI